MNKSEQKRVSIIAWLVFAASLACFCFIIFRYPDDGGIILTLLSVGLAFIIALSFTVGFISVPFIHERLTYGGK